MTSHITANCVLPPHNAAFLPVKMRSLLIIAEDAWCENAPREESVEAQPCVGQLCRDPYVTQFSINALPPWHKNILPSGYSSYSITASSNFTGSYSSVSSFRDAIDFPIYKKLILCSFSVFLSQTHLYHVVRTLILCPDWLEVTRPLSRWQIFVGNIRHSSRLLTAEHRKLTYDCVKLAVNRTGNYDWSGFREVCVTDSS